MGQEWGKNVRGKKEGQIRVYITRFALCPCLFCPALPFEVSA